MRKANPKYTVYIVSHNYGKYLQNAIDSVLRQSVDSWELFLINNNSSDNTQDIMDIYKGDPRIKIYKPAGTGLPAAANLALRKARGKYIIRLDADDVFEENILLVLGNYLDRHPDVVLVFPDYFLINEIGGFINYERRQPLNESNHSPDMPANGACTMIRKTVLEKIGGYREDLNAQDGFDLWSRVIRDAKCANVNIPLFYYRRHSQNLTDNQFRILTARRTIKKDICTLDLEKYRPIMAVIPCRKNFDIFPDLWAKKINNRTLLERAIETCIKNPILDKIVVTADTSEVRKTMKKYPDKRLSFTPRTYESTIPSFSITESLEQVLKQQKIGYKGLTVLCYLQSPFVLAETLEEAVYTVIMNEADSAIVVEEVTQPVYKRVPHGLMLITPTGKFRTDFDRIYVQVRVVVACKNSNIKTGNLTGARIVAFEIPTEEAFFINTLRDYEVASLLKRD